MAKLRFGFKSNAPPLRPVTQSAPSAVDRTSSYANRKIPSPKNRPSLRNRGQPPETLEPKLACANLRQTRQWRPKIRGKVLHSQRANQGPAGQSSVHFLVTFSPQGGLVSVVETTWKDHRYARSHFDCRYCSNEQGCVESKNARRSIQCRCMWFT